jgi:hypothetical protein
VGQGAPERTNICCDFYRTEFHSSDERQHSGSLMRCGSRFADDSLVRRLSGLVAEADRLSALLKKQRNLQEKDTGYRDLFKSHSNNIFQKERCSNVC